MKFPRRSLTNPVFAVFLLLFPLALAWGATPGPRVTARGPASLQRSDTPASQDPDLDLSGSYAYPVPFKPALGHTHITFSLSCTIATIRIYTLSGSLVRELIETDGNQLLRWDVTDGNGDPLGSGIYFYVIQNPQERKTGKLMIVR